MNPFGNQLLNVITYLPLAGALVLLAFPKESKGLIAKFATVVAGLGFLMQEGIVNAEALQWAKGAGLKAVMGRCIYKEGFCRSQRRSRY